MTLPSKTSKGNGLVYHVAWPFQTVFKTHEFKNRTIDINTLPEKR